MGRNLILAGMVALATALGTPAIGQAETTAQTVAAGWKMDSKWNSKSAAYDRKYQLEAKGWYAVVQKEGSKWAVYKK